jgi:hypothetical protein
MTDLITVPVPLWTILLGFTVGALVASLFLRATKPAGPNEIEHLGVEAGWPVGGVGGRNDDRTKRVPDEAHN